MENKNIRIVERYYFLEEEHAEFGYTEDSVGYEKFLNDKSQGVTGTQTDYWIDSFSEQLPDGSIIDTNGGTPAYKKKDRKRRTTKGDRISEIDSEDLEKEKL